MISSPITPPKAMPKADFLNVFPESFFIISAATRAQRAFIINVPGAYTKYPENRSARAEPSPAQRAPSAGPSKKPQSNTKPSPG